MKEEDPIGCSHWLVFFKDSITGRVTALDARDPQECYRSIKSKYPTQEFYELRGCDSQGSAAEMAKAIRLGTRLIDWAHAQAQKRRELLTEEERITEDNAETSGRLASIKPALPNSSAA